MLFRSHQRTRMGLTTQIKSLDNADKGIILAHTNQVNSGRQMRDMELFPIVKSEFHVVDYLNFIGLESEDYEGVESDLRKLPKCYIVLYGHFLTAELNIIFSGSLKEKIKNLQREKSPNLPRINNSRRLFCEQTIEGYKLDFVSLNHIISINGYEYELCLKFIDTAAIHGVASYKDFCSAVGLNLKYKDNFSAKEKSKMLSMVIERPKDFEQYALGDLEVFSALALYDKQWQLVYEKLGMCDYYQVPKLTIGGTVKDLFVSALANLFELSSDNDSNWMEKVKSLVDEYIQPASADYYRKYTRQTRSLLSKVEGGRCRNNRPTDLNFERKIRDGFDVNLLCDIDISGCYGEGQRNQEYFFGKPEIFDYEHSRNNDYISLRQWLIQYGVKVDKLIQSTNKNDFENWNNQDNWGELLSGCWYARISAKSE